MASGTQQALKVVVTGPESTGKSSLATALAGRLNLPFVPEFARFALQDLGRPYQRRDLEWIGRGQRGWERWYRQQQPEGLLILDTDWTVLEIWETFRFGLSEAPFWQRGYGQPELPDLYLLCRPDFPWMPDPLRENPQEQMQLFDLYVQLLRRQGTPFLVMEGDPETRVLKALEIIDRTF